MNSYNLNIFIIIWVSAFILTRLGLSRMFKLGGKNPLIAWIPILNWWHWIQLVNRPKWYMIGMVIPGLNILFSFNIKLDILRSFGKNRFWEQFAGIVLTFAYFPYLFFDKSLKFLGGAGSKEWREKNLKKQGGIREWSDAILFAAYVAGGMRALYFDLYQIPTPSMESNLMVGDYLVVSRTNVGMRIPLTPITVPVLAPKEIAGIKAYSELVEFPYMRLPGWYTIKNNDVIVFNWPADKGFPTDKKDNYVKRCVGIPGDSIKIINSQVMINNKPLPAFGKQQQRYLVLLKYPMSTEFLIENQLGDFNQPSSLSKLNQEKIQQEGLYAYHIYTWKENSRNISKYPGVTKLELDIEDQGYDRFLFPDARNNKYLKHNWDLNNYGPFYLPKRGETIQLSPQNWDWYKLAIQEYEGRDDIIESEGKFYKNGGSESITEYTFKYGYYWMMGDNRYNSYDSRMWGYVPEDHILGKPLFTFFSLKKVIGIMDTEFGPQPMIEGQTMMYESHGVRWDRIFRKIE
ncbi:MAG: signal peptidase I [Bacteroidia bacterium]